MSQPDNSRFAPFPSTRWTLVRRLKNGGEVEAAEAMNELCRLYWYPIYAFARRHGFPTHDAEDITQTFFQRIVTSEAIHDAQEEKGQLRSFMLAMLKRIIANHVRHASTQKRGGTRLATISFDDLNAEERYEHEPATLVDPDALFDRAWAERVLDQAAARLRDEFALGNNLVLFEAIQDYLPYRTQEPASYPDVASDLAMKEGAVRQQVSRMRKRYATLIEEHIAQTVEGENEQREELQYLVSVMGG